MTKQNTGCDNFRIGCQPLIGYVNSVRLDYQEMPSILTESTIKGHFSGFPKLDQITGGLTEGSLTVVGGRPAMGSTSLALSIAQHVALKCDKSVVIFSLAFDGRETARRLLASTARVPMYELYYGRIDDHRNARLEDAIEQIRNATIHIDDTAIGLFEIRKSIESLICHERTPDLVVIDDLQSLSPNMKSAEHTETTVRRIKELAQDIGAAVIVTTRLSRRIDKREFKMPLLMDVPSGVITGGADVVITLYRDECYWPDTLRKGLADVCVCKNRHGKIGLLELRFDAECGLFSAC